MPSPTSDQVHTPNAGGAKKKPATPPKPMGKKPFPGAAPPFGKKEAPKKKGK